MLYKLVSCCICYTTYDIMLYNAHCHVVFRRRRYGISFACLFSAKTVMRQY